MTSTASILFVHSRDISTPLGSTVPHYLTKRLSDQHEVHVICPKQDGEHDPAYADTVSKAYHPPTGSIPILSPLAFTLSASILAIVLGGLNRYDVVYGYKVTMIQGFLASRIGASRFVIGLQVVPVRQYKEFNEYRDRDAVRGIVEEVILWLYSSMVGVLLEKADDIICLTEGIRELTVEEYDIDSSHMHVVGMGIDTDHFGCDVTERDGSADRWVITYVGTVTNRRNIHHVVRAIGRSDHSFEFRVVGNFTSADYRDRLARVAAEEEVADRLDIRGVVPHDEIPSLLRDSDITVSPLPGIESYRVSFPAKLLEYLAACTVVVCSDIDPHQRLVRHGENGYLYDGTVDGLVSTLDTVVEERSRHREIEKQARETSLEYDWDAIVGRHERILLSG